MNSGFQLILGTSCHIPNGCGEDEFEYLYNREIKPLISAVYQFPKVHMAVHYSGSLFNWLERKHPELIMLLGELLNRKQAEILGGGFYEPLLPLLPQVDKVGQHEMLTTYIRKQFGRRPLGCWIPALAWEHNLVGALSTCGMAYTFLEDFRFAPYGMENGRLQDNVPFYAPCFTEDQGKLITVFPISLRLSKEFYRPYTIKKLSQSFENAGEYPVSVFPIWDHDENSELEALRFFEGLSNSGIDFTLPGRVHKNMKGLKRLYFPSLPPNDDGLAARPRQFFTTYPEANGIYSKMIHTRNFINQLRGDVTRKRNALEELWKAQDCGIFCKENCALARSQGIYTPGLSRSNLRKAAYRALLEAEKTSREKKTFSPSLSLVDFDLDGEAEYLFSDDKVNAYIKAEGAGLFELDYLPVAWNYLDVFVDNKPEAITAQGAVRRSFVDYLVPAGFSGDPASCADARFCGNEIFELEEADRVKRKLVFRLSANGGSGEGENKNFSNIEILKTWQMKKSVVSLRYALKNTGTADAKFIFITRAVLSFPGDTPDCLRILAARGTAKEPAKPGVTIRESTGLDFQDIKNEAVLILESNRAFNAIFHSESSGKTYQYTETLFQFPVKIEAGKTWEVDFTLRISS